MALPTWQELKRHASGYPSGAKGPLVTNPTVAKQYFDWMMKNSTQIETWRNYKDKKKLIQRLVSLVGFHVRDNDGKYVAPGIRKGPVAGYTWKEVNKNKNFAASFKNYLENPTTGRVGGGVRRDLEIGKIADLDISLEEKYNRLTTEQRASARRHLKAFEPKIGKISAVEFAPYTNFKSGYIKHLYNFSKMDLPKGGMTSKNVNEYNSILRAKGFFKFYKDNGIEVFQEGPRQAVYFTDPNKSQQKALLDFYNQRQVVSKLDRHKVLKDSRAHPLYKDTSANLNSVLKAAKVNLNSTIEGMTDSGLRRYLEKNPNLLKNATMWFDSAEGRMKYTDVADLKNKGFNFPDLRRNLVFEIEHNRSVDNYWKKMSKNGRILAKYNALNDSNFAHNLTVDTARYNKAKEVAVRWIENNPTEIKKIDALGKEMGKLGHRLYAGDEWIGRQLEFKPTYKATAIDSWTKALEKSTGFKLSDHLKKVTDKTWRMAMKQVEMEPAQLRALGNLFGCPQTFKGMDEGGRVRLQAGGQGLVQCVDTKLKQPGALEKVAQLPEEVGGALGKLKNVARGFLGALGRFGPAAGKFGAIAAAGAVAKPAFDMVRQFVNDDPSTYLTDPEQMERMLLSTIEAQERKKPRSEILDWSHTAGTVGATAAAVPGTGALYKARRAKGMGPLRAGSFGPAMKLISGMFTPAGLMATEPLRIAQKRREGESWGEIGTDPTMWMGPAFAPGMTKLATRGMNPASLLPKLLRLGMSRAALAAIGPVGWAGLAASLGWEGYSQYQDYKKGRGFFASDEE